MYNQGRHAIVSSHISSAFKHPSFYSVPPSKPHSSSSHQPHPSNHASKTLLDRLQRSSKANAASDSSSGQLQSLEDHALHATIVNLPQLGDALLRLTHSGFVLELTLLEWAEGSPICWEFAEPIVPMPGVTVPSSTRTSLQVARNRATHSSSNVGQLAFVYVLLKGGTLYRLSFPLIAPFFHDEQWIAKKGWLREFTLPSTVSRPLSEDHATMLLQGERSLTVTVNAGAVLRLDVEGDADTQMKDKLHYPQHQGLLSKMFRTTNPEEDSIISVHCTQIDQTDSNPSTRKDLTFTLSRDRSLRVWDSVNGNFVTHAVPPLPQSASGTMEDIANKARGGSLIRASSLQPLHQSNTPTIQPLPLERRTLIRSFFTQNTRSTDSLRLIVFMPTPHGIFNGPSQYPEPPSAGFFILYKFTGHSLVKLAEKEASSRTSRCALRDFVVKPKEENGTGYEIHCLWERAGESLYEYAELDDDDFTAIVTSQEQERSRHTQQASNSSDIQMREVTSPPRVRPVDDDEDEESSDSYPYESTWHLVLPLSPSTSSQFAASTSLQANDVDFLSTLDLTSPNIASTILNALFRPGGGGFSPYTIFQALKGYVEAAWVPADHVDPLKDPNSRLRAALSKQYPSLRATVGAIVGCRLKDPDTRLEVNQNPFNPNVNGELASSDQQSEYFSALRRDWEGFLARCREIEKAGRWPVSLGLVGSGKDETSRVRSRGANIGGCIVLERERMGMLVGDDEPLGLYRRILEEVDVSDETEYDGDMHTGGRWNGEDQYQLVRLALSLKALLSPSSWADVTDKLYATLRENMSMTYEDLLLHLAQEVAMDDLDDETAFWVFNQLETFDDGTQFAVALDAISMTIRSTGNAEAAEMVKQEDDEEEVGRMLLHQPIVSELPNSLGVSAANDASRVIDHHNQWTRSLTASYASATLEARYDIASSVLFLLMLLKSRNHGWMENVNAVVIDELFAGLRSSSLLRQTASRVLESERENARSTDFAEDTHGNTAISTSANLVRAGTADSMAIRLANMRVAGTSALRPTNRPTKAPPGPHVQFAAPTGSAYPTLPSFIRGTGTVPLLQNLLPPLKRAFHLPYASDAFLYSNGIIRYDSMLIACADEVRFAEELRRGGHLNAAADVIDWLPKGNACCYVAGRLRVQRGDYDEAADLFERSGRSFGPLAFRNETEVAALQAVLPRSLENLDSLSDYYHHIAMLFEEQSQFQLAVPFYKLAIENAQSESVVTDLWYNVFRGQLLREDFEDAYMSVVEMPGTMKGQSVAELITAMCERNKVELMMSFNFVGLTSEVEEALGHHARTADPLMRPTYSQILYSWYIRRGDYREAASVMYQRARILGSQNKADMEYRFFILTEQADSYIIAINALCLLDSRDAWISLPVSQDSGQVPFEWRELNFGGFVPEGNYAAGSRDCEIIELDDMRKEYELCRSRRELLIATIPYTGRPPIEADFNRSPMEILHLYCNIGMFEQALGTARIFQMDMTVIFTMLVDMCLLLTRSGEVAIGSQRRWIESETIANWEGSLIQKGWKLLQYSLERHDAANAGWKYRKICFEHILDSDRATLPPTWLTSFFQDHEPEYLIRTCLRYHLVLSAIEFTLLMIKKANRPFTKDATVAVTQTHLPYILIDAVVSAARTAEEKQRAALIRSEINARIGKVGKWDWN